MIRTRFAPSPTGELHIGVVRTALFAYLFAKSQKGEFLLRIEDTDRERYVKDSEKRIVESLNWLGIIPDNNKQIVTQSERLDKYKEAVLKLLQRGKAYICDCSKDKLEKMRTELVSKGLPPIYDESCSKKKQSLNNMSELENAIKDGCVVRMKMPNKGKIVIDDLVRGKVEFDASLIDDQVILKSDGFPTYHLASVVDDHEMKITHVIRAEEWLSSTPKHIVLYEAFGWEAPKFAHLSMIFGLDKKKLSKRHGATSIKEYQDQGYLPEAIINMLALMGWNPKDEREFFTMDELIAEFKMENVNKAPAIFNIEKLNSINEHYIRESIEKDEKRIQKLLSNFGVKDITHEEMDLIGRGGFITLVRVCEYIKQLRKEPEYDGKILVFSKSDKKTTLKGLQSALASIETIETWGTQELQMQLGLTVTRENLTNGDVFWPVRVALSGEEKSPSPVELLLALGKEESIKRIKKAITKLST
jgi:glutamyl-tRNA synthetase